MFPSVRKGEGLTRGWADDVRLLAAWCGSGPRMAGSRTSKNYFEVVVDNADEEWISKHKSLAPIIMIN